MSAAPGTIPPPVSWAQRNDLLYVIIDVECKDIAYSVRDTSFHFKGVNALDENTKYDVTLTFLHPVDPTRVTNKNIGRCMEFTIYKKESGPYWPSLVATKTKLHFLKANFSKWINESDEEDGEPDMNEMDLLNPQMNWGAKANDFDLDDEDDSDDNIPSLSNNDEDDEEKTEDKPTKEQEK